MKLLPKQYAKVLYELTKDAGKKEIDKIVEQFIIFLAKEQMLSKMKYIIEEFVCYSKEKDGIKQLKVASARPLSKPDINRIARYFGDKVEVEAIVDKSLIGGVKIKSKNTIMDASLKTQLDRLKIQLI